MVRYTVVLEHYKLTDLDYGIHFKLISLAVLEKRISTYRQIKTDAIRVPFFLVEAWNP